jgi:hypothetical protein
VKTKKFLAALAVALAFVMPLAAQTTRIVTNDPYTLDLLRRTLDEQKKNAGKVVRTPETAVSASTNAAAGPQASAPAAKSPELATLERQYIEGKISAKQFQKEFEKLQLQKEQREKAAAAAAATSAAPPKPLVTPATSPKGAAAAGVAVPASQPAFPTPPPQPNPNQKKLTDVEVRLDEMIRKKLEREKAAKEAAAAAAITNNPSGAPLTKRQHLDALLKQVVDGKLTDAEYKAQRDKIAAEPD